MTRAVIDRINPNTCSTEDALFYWFGLPIRECDLSYAVNIVVGYYLSMKDVECVLSCKVNDIAFKSNKNGNPARINIVRDNDTGPVRMDMGLKDSYSRIGMGCQDMNFLEYILPVFASPLFRGEYFHVITGIYLREREEDEADIYSLKKPKKALDRRSGVVKDEDRAKVSAQLPENTTPIYTKTFFAPVLVRGGAGSVLCILLICFERPPLKKHEIRSNMSDEEKNKVYDISHRPHKLVSATLIRFDDVERVSEKSGIYRSIRGMLRSFVNTTEYNKAKKHFERINWNGKAADAVNMKSTGRSASTKQSAKKVVSEELVLVPEEHAESHFFIRSDPENIEKCHMLHEYNRDMETYVLVLKRKENAITDTDNTEVTALMFLNPGKQFKMTEIKRKRGCRAKNQGLIQVDMLWYVYEKIWRTMKGPNRVCGNLEPYRKVSQQAYYTPDWCRDKPREYELEVERYRKEKAKEFCESVKKRNDKNNRKRRKKARGKVPR